MQTEIRELYPNWIDSIDKKINNAGFTADMDGLLCSSFAKEHLGLEVNSFYNFKAMMKIDPTDTRETIFFDSALREGKCFDNHMTRSNEISPYNVQSANINNVTGVHLGKYTTKFAMSTLIQLYALYNVPLPTTLQGKMILLCCDVGFKGYYDNRYKTTFLSYLEMFGMLELVEVLEMFTIEQMYEYMLLAHMNCKIRRQGNNGKLTIDMDSRNPRNAHWINFKTGMDLDWYTKNLEYTVQLPAESFEVVETFQTQVVDSYDFTSKMQTEAFSYAYINQQKIMVSIRKGEAA